MATYPKPEWNAEKVDCKTQAQLEKALKAAKVANVLAGTLSLVCNAGDAPKIILNADVKISIEAWGSSSPSIVAWGSSSPSIVARGSSSPSIVARESSSPSIVARESSSPSIEAWGSSSPSIVARESSSPSIEAWGSSSPSIVAWGSSSPSIEARESSSPSIEARESSSPSIVAWESSSPSIVARESSSPSIVAWESSSPSIVARESSSPSIEAWGSSSPSIVARGYSMIRAKGKVTGTAADTVSLHLWKRSHIEGGRQQIINLSTPEDWCGYYGARTDGEFVILYKAVNAGYRSDWGTVYAPGTMPRDEQWDGQKRECSAGGGLNFSPTPRHTHQFVSRPAHYLECRVRLEDLVVHFDGQYPEKVCAQEVVAPLIEVDVNGKPVALLAEA